MRVVPVLVDKVQQHRSSCCHSDPMVVSTMWRMYDLKWKNYGTVRPHLGATLDFKGETEVLTVALSLQSGQ